jgi:hypothetical protein
MCQWVVGFAMHTGNKFESPGIFELRELSKSTALKTRTPPALAMLEPSASVKKKTAAYEVSSALPHTAAARSRASASGWGPGRNKEPGRNIADGITDTGL